MIYLRLAGGLGNQLFQLSAAYNILRNKAAHKIVVVDKSLESYKIKRTLESRDLIKNIPNFIYDGSHMKKIYLCDKLRAGRWFPFRSVNDNNYANKRKLFGDRDLSIDLYLDGYFQNSQCLDDIISFSKKLHIERNNTSMNAGCTIHLRGGDFLKLKDYNICDFNYYIKCVTTCIAKGVQNYVILSDDEIYAKALWVILSEKFSKEANFTIRERESNAIEDLLYLSNSKYLIIGNSTFAWWGACLSSNLQLMFSPDKWTQKRYKLINLKNESVVSVQ